MEKFTFFRGDCDRTLKQKADVSFFYTNDGWCNAWQWFYSTVLLIWNLFFINCKPFLLPLWVPRLMFTIHPKPICTRHNASSFDQILCKLVARISKKWTWTVLTGIFSELLPTVCISRSCDILRLYSENLQQQFSANDSTSHHWSLTTNLQSSFRFFPWLFFLIFEAYVCYRQKNRNSVTCSDLLKFYPSVAFSFLFPTCSL